MEPWYTEINQRLSLIIDAYCPTKVRDAMLYSLLAGGKRIRPIFCLQVMQSYGYDYHPYLDLACAIEMVHTYSLIHDDLPAMDNDDLRRGKPTCHKQFDEATAILAGDALLNESIRIVLKMNLTPSMRVDLSSILLQASGLEGMIYGQELDARGEHTSESDLIDLHLAKTGALLGASFALGACVVTRKKEEIAAWKHIGESIGLAFQIQDDILDVTGDALTLGKNPGSDKANHKVTYCTLLGIKEAQERADLFFNQAIESVRQLAKYPEPLVETISLLRKRVK